MDLSEDFQELSLDPLSATSLKSAEELEKHTVDEQLTDIERAVYLLSSGQEVQRLSVIHNLPDLLQDSHAECMRRVVPKVREVLHVAQTEMQLAASSAFLQILQKQLVPLQNYTQTFLQTILSSVDNRDPDIASAWLDTLLDVIDLLPKEVIKRDVMSVAVAKGQLSQSVQSRLACCRMLGKIATKFEPFVIKKDILPVVQSLCQDVEYEVRGCMCRQLDCVARGLGLEATKSAILPELVELTNDEESYVRLAGLDTVVNILSLLDDETCVNTIVPLVCKLCQQALASKDSTLPFVARQLGKLTHGLSVNLNEDQKQWFIDFYKKLCRTGVSEKSRAAKDSESNAVNKTVFQNIPSDLFPEEEDMDVECRRNASFNFPAMVLFTGPRYFKSELLSTFNCLCNDPSHRVRKTVATGFHEIAKLLGNNVHLLQSDLVTLLKDDSIEVLRGVVTNLPDTLELFSKGSNSTATQEHKNAHSEVIPAILAAEAVISASNNWRLQSDIIQKLACLPISFTSDSIYQKIIPLIYKKLHSARAQPVKRSAARTLLVLLRHIKKQDQREDMCERLLEDLCFGRSFYQRSLFIEVCKLVIELYSKSFFKQHFFEAVLELGQDPVPNIRLQLCPLLPKLKGQIKLPTDRNLLQQLETCVRKLLVNEKDRDVTAAIRIAVDEMDRTQVQMESISKLSHRLFCDEDAADKKKEEEEEMLIQLEEKERKEEEARQAKSEKKKEASGKKDSSQSKIPAPRRGTRPPATSTSSGKESRLEKIRSERSGSIPGTSGLRTERSGSFGSSTGRESKQNELKRTPSFNATDSRTSLSKPTKSGSRSSKIASSPSPQPSSRGSSSASSTGSRRSSVHSIPSGSQIPTAQSSATNRRSSIGTPDRKGSATRRISTGSMGNGINPGVKKKTVPK